MSIHSTVLKEGHRHGSLELEHKACEGPLVHEATLMEYVPSLADYLSSPIRTLCESVEDVEQDFISDHDVVEAYNVLCARIRSRKADLSKATAPVSLSDFQKDVPLLVLCISRDIQRVLPNPFESTPHRSEQSYDINHPIDNMPPTMDHMLCQCAIRLMSDLFMYPFLYSMFSQSQISTLLQDALSLCMPATSWVFDIERLRCTVLLMLKMQQLSPDLLRPDLNSVLNALLCVTDAQDGTMGKLDGLSVISSLLQKYPTFLPRSVPFLPSILKNLKMDDLDVRLAAARALSSFAFAKHNLLRASLPASTLYQLSNTVHNYLTDEHCKSLPPDNSLPLIVESAIADDSRSFWKKKGPLFAISLLSALAILLDYRIFISPRSLKLFFLVIRVTAGRRWKHLAVHSDMWKILLWSFSRIPRTEEHLSSPMADGQDLEGWNDTREKAYRVLKQDVRDGIGTAFVTVLLHCGAGDQRDPEDVGKALEIMEDVMKCDGRTEKNDVLQLLEKLMCGIGAASDGGEGDRALQVRFSKQLVDGSLVGKRFRDLTTQPNASSIGSIQPLSEPEAFSFWDKLSEIWSSSVQDCLLHSDDDLSHKLFEIWQALLLVQGQLTESHQHLTASPAFTYRVVSIVKKISSPLGTPRAQARYLNTISKLWTVMRNVFGKTWLPSPAERILASVLSKRFDLSDETVKSYWGQLCAELISFGIPTLLHVLHTKTMSPSQEETELSKHLWVVLAENASMFGPSEDTDVPKDDWMYLVQLLVLPFGAWSLMDAEVDIWKMTFSRAVEAAASVLQPTEVVISVLLDSLGASKLDYLKTELGVLHCLLSYLVRSPFANVTFKLLSVFDSVLQTSYPCIAEKKTRVLDFLGLLSKLIAQARDSEMLQIIAAMPHGLCKWIADEETVLSDLEHRQLVTTVYSESLQRLATIEPSLDCLRILANFLHSAFVRVRNEGLLSFATFWRSTYHQRKGVSKRDYPLAIRACLKAWSDVCDDSFADDISLGSNSQSLESYVIPDSQPSPQKVGDGEHMVIEEMASEVKVPSDDEGSQGTVTPKARLYLTSLPPVVRSRNSITDSKAQEASSDGCMLEGSPVTRSKRRLDLESSQAPKKRRIGPRFLRSSLKQPSSSKSSHERPSVSEPVTRMSSLSPIPPGSYSQLLAPPRRKLYREETPSWLGSDLKRQRGGDMPSSDDYDTWEQNVLMEEIENLGDDVADAGRVDSPASEKILLSALGPFPLGSRKRKRSQTALEPSPSPDPYSHR